MAKVTTIAEWRNRETVAVIRELLAKAEAGEVLGLAFAVNNGEMSHGIGLTGVYREDPIQTLAIAARITHVVNCLIDERRERKAL